jgi:hypothetical protein
MATHKILDKHFSIDKGDSKTQLFFSKVKESWSFKVEFLLLSDSKIKIITC